GAEVDRGLELAILLALTGQPNRLQRQPRVARRCHGPVPKLRRRLERPLRGSENHITGLEAGFGCRGTLFDRLDLRGSSKSGEGAAKRRGSRTVTDTQPRWLQTLEQLAVVAERRKRRARGGLRTRGRCGEGTGVERFAFRERIVGGTLRRVRSGVSPEWTRSICPARELAAGDSEQDG